MRAFVLRSKISRSTGAAARMRYQDLLPALFEEGQVDGLAHLASDGVKDDFLRRQSGVLQVDARNLVLQRYNLVRLCFNHK